MNAMKMRRYAFAFLILTVFGSCREQQNNDNAVTIEVTSHAQPVITSTPPTTITRNLIQDRKGNIWMASWEGVFRYDGKAFINVTLGETSARFFSLIEDRSGNLWFGSIGEGVYRYDGNVFRNFTIKDGLLNNEVTSIYQDRSGHIWFGVNGGLSRYDGRAFKNYIINGDTIAEDRTGKWLPDVRPPNEVNAIIEDRNGKYWFATRGNTFLFDGKAFMVFNNAGKAFQNVRTLIEDGNGNIWFGGNDGLWRYDGNTFTNLNANFSGAVYEDKSGNIWTGAQSDGISTVPGINGNRPGWALSRYDAKSLSAKAPAATQILAGEDMTFGILEAADGSIWVGTARGVKRYDGNTIIDFKAKTE